MQRFVNKVIDIGEYAIGAPLFFIVSGLTAAVMAIGFVPITVYQRVFK